jgi:hypothetical protein
MDDIKETKASLHYGKEAIHTAERCSRPDQVEVLTITDKD